MPFDEESAVGSLRRGLGNRREVLGDAWVDRSIGNANTFNVEFQQMITSFAWDKIWSRPGLDRQFRRLLVLAITASMGRWEEFELHIRTGLQADPLKPESAPLDLDMLKEVLLQTAVYAGVPAGNTAIAITLKILAELQRSPPPASFGVD